MDKIRTQSIESRRLLSFFLIALSFTWFFWLPDALYKMGAIPPSPLTGLGFIGAFGPLVSAVLVTAGTEGSVGLKALFKKAVDGHFGKAWWFVVLLMLPIFVLAAFLPAVLMDGVVPPSMVLAEPWILFPAFFSVLFLSGPFEEEFGWRGYALPRLQAKCSAFVSSLVLGLVWAAWHFPQFLIPGNGMFYKTPIWTYVPTVIVVTILFTWVYNNTNGSLLAMLLLHTTWNLSLFVFPVLDTSLGYVYVLGILIMATALVLGIFGHSELIRANRPAAPQQST